MTRLLEAVVENQSKSEQTYATASSTIRGEVRKFTTADLLQCLCDHTHRANRFSRRVSRKNRLNSCDALRHREKFLW